MRTTILVAYGGSSSSEVLMDALSEQGSESEVVQVCENGEALAYLRRRGRYDKRPPGLPAVMLLDLEAPCIDGFLLLEELKRDPDLRVVPVVCLGMSNRDDDVTRSYRLGANAYVVKPTDPEQLIARIRRIGQYWIEANEPPSRLN